MGDSIRNEFEAAERLGVSVHTLRSWRCTGKGKRPPSGPPFVRLGSRRIGYRESDLSAWVAGSVVQTVATVSRPRAAAPEANR